MITAAPHWEFHSGAHFFSGSLLWLYCRFTGHRFVWNWALIKTLCILGLFSKRVAGTFILLCRFQSSCQRFVYHSHFSTDFHLCFGTFVACQGICKIAFSWIILWLTSIFIIVLPETRLPSKNAAIWVLLAYLSSFFNACENI